MNVLDAEQLYNRLTEIKEEYGSLKDIPISIWISEEYSKDLLEELTPINHVDVIEEHLRLHSINLNVYS